MIDQKYMSEILSNPASYRGEGSESFSPSGERPPALLGEKQEWQECDTVSCSLAMIMSGTKRKNAFKLLYRVNLREPVVSY
jgi:hypothetical protein